LALDLTDELSDFAGRGFGLLALNADQRSLLFLIGKVTSNTALATSTRLTTATNSMTYLMNSRLRTTVPPSVGTVTGGLVDAA
jgi:hypothetical protein